MADEQPPPTPPPGWHDDPQDPTRLRYWDGGQWTDQRAPKPSAAESPPPPPTSTTGGGWEPARIVAMVGAGLIVLGSVGPWASINSAFGSIDVNGTDGDGVITLVGGGVVALLVLIAKYLAGWIVSGLTAAVLVYDLFDVARAVGETDSEFLEATVGWGLYVGTGGAVMALLGCFRIWRRGRRATTPGPGPDAPTV